MESERVNAPERHRDLLDGLTRQAEMLRTSEGWQEWLAFASRFKTYSFRNQLLVLMQRPDATRVAGYKAWKAIGRQVNKGERGIAILAPRTRVVEEEGERKNVLCGFHVVRVFDVSQTSGAPLPEITMPEVSGSSEQIFGALVAAASSEELEVRQIPPPEPWDGARGWIDHRERVITLVDFGQGLDSMTRTLLHELGHHCDPAASHSFGPELKPVLEVTAESAAMIVGTASIGLDMREASATYVATWMEAFDALDAGFMAELAEHALRVARRLESIVMPHLNAMVVTSDEDVLIPEGIG